MRNFTKMWRAQGPWSAWGPSCVVPSCPLFPFLMVPRSHRVCSLLSCWPNILPLVSREPVEHWKNPSYAQPPLQCLLPCESEVVQLCPALWDSMGCSPPASSIHGIFQARILEWVAISFSRGSSWPRDQTQVSHIAGRLFTIWATREAISFLASHQKPELGYTKSVICRIKYK